MLVQGCSWSIRFYVINNTPVSRTVTIEVENAQGGFLIFDPRNFSLLPYSDDSIDYERTRRLPQGGSISTIEIPPHTALEIGHLNNDRYEHSKQQFINGRIFNLKRIRSGGTEVNRDNFDAHFRKMNSGYAWALP
jgi:hypothetical protein